MSKPVLLVAQTFLAYGARQYGVGMQFNADPKDVDALVESGQAAVVTAEDKKAIAAAEQGAAPAVKK